MRKDLQKIEGDRTKFTGTFVRFGIKNGYKGPVRTVLLASITNEAGQIVTDHLWFNLTKGFERLDLHEGDRVEFFARVKQYQKGYFGYREDVYKPIETDYKPSPMPATSASGKTSLSPSCSSITYVRFTTLLFISRLQVASIL